MEKPKIGNSALVPFLGTGIGLRPTHYQFVLETKPQTPWFEAISENYMGIESGSGGRPFRVLEKIRQDREIVLHGVSLSIGSIDPLDQGYLKRLKRLVDKIQPAWISDHLCWTGVEGENLHDLLPLPYTEEALSHLVSRIDQVQNFLGRRVLFENPSSYLGFTHSEMTEWEFLAELANRADCGILLDINNVYVSSMNQCFNPYAYLDAIPKGRVGQMHLAGHSNQGKFLLDTHDHPVSESVWDLYRKAIERFGAISTLVEWDAKIPEFSVLENEARRATRIQTEVLDEVKEEANELRTYAEALAP